MLSLTGKSEKPWTERLALKLAKKFAKEMNAGEIDYLKIKLGIEIVLINLAKGALVYLLAWFFNILPLTLVLHGSYFLVRRFSYGLHAKSSLICTIVSIIAFVVLPYVAKDMTINNYFVLPVFLLLLLCFYFYAPADTEKSPLLGAERRKRLRNKTLQTCLILMLGALLISNPTLKLMITLGVCVQAIFILPITYKLLNRSRDNYEKIENCIN